MLAKRMLVQLTRNMMGGKVSAFLFSLIIKVWIWRWETDIIPGVTGSAIPEQQSEFSLITS